MATTATTVINDVLKRMRDPNSQLMATDNPPTTGTGRSFVLTLINYCTIMMIWIERLIIGTVNLTLTTNTTIYDMTTVASDYGGKVIGCFVSGVGEIDGPVDFQALGRGSRTWGTDVTSTLSAPITWAPIGANLIAFTPAFSSAPPTVTIRYLKAPTFLTMEASNIALPDFSASHLARLVTLVASLKSRQLTDFQARLEEFIRDTGLTDTLQNKGGKAD